MKQVLNVNGVTITVEASPPDEVPEQYKEDTCSLRRELRDALDLNTDDDGRTIPRTNVRQSQ